MNLDLSKGAEKGYALKQLLPFVCAQVLPNIWRLALSLHVRRFCCSSKSALARFVLFRPQFCGYGESANDAASTHGLAEAVAYVPGTW